MQIFCITQERADSNISKIGNDSKYFQGRVSRYDEAGAYECLLCPYGCDTCIDDRPCVVSLNWLMRSGILILQIVIILMLPIVGLFTWRYSEVKVSDNGFTWSYFL